MELMASFFQQILNVHCSHRFAWPRVSVNGQHYQVCLSCGATYQYDWTTMRRSSRVIRVDSKPAYQPKGQALKA
jgi:hypothetical protein